MTCQCKAKMCYLCKEKVTDYNHFYGQGGVPTETKKCSLYTNSKVLHATELARAAQEVRQKLKEANVKLDIDPLKDIPDVTVQESTENVRAGTP